MKSIKLNKEEYSDYVVRQALYWMTAITEWTLDENNTYFEVCFFENNNDILFKFNQLLNDYTLREKIDFKTKHIRNSIISKVLVSLDKRLSE